MGFLQMRIHIYSTVTLWIEDRFLWRSSSHCLHSSACLHQVNQLEFVIGLPVCLLCQFSTLRTLRSISNFCLIFGATQEHVNSVCVSVTRKVECASSLTSTHLCIQINNIFAVLIKIFTFLFNFRELFSFHISGMHPYLCHYVSILFVHNSALAH